MLYGLNGSFTNNLDDFGLTKTWQVWRWVHGQLHWTCQSRTGLALPLDCDSLFFSFPLLFRPVHLLLCYFFLCLFALSGLVGLLLSVIPRYSHVLLLAGWAYGIWPHSRRLYLDFTRFNLQCCYWKRERNQPPVLVFCGVVAQALCFSSFYVREGTWGCSAVYQ